ncbi:MAG: hypothetical protein H0U53_01325 [Actinobacteria bacterium]|nr:hypothetical protein [Actinomycetota bacterium]
MDDPQPRPRRLLAILLILSLGSAVAFAALWLGSKDTEPEEVTASLSAQSSTVEATATKVIDALLDYDSASLEEQREELLALSTGTFRDQYEELIANDLEVILERTSASSEGDIADGPDVSFESASRAVAIARVVQEVTARGSGTKNVFYVMRLTLISDPSGWKADTLQILSQQST